MNDQKVVRDWILTTQDTIYALQEWLGRLELWQSSGQVDPADFAEACRLLQEAGLWGWAREVGGHDLLNFDAYAVGYINHAHYIQQFWGAYLGAEAMQVWNYIRSFYPEPRYIYDKKEKAYLLNPAWTPWTPPLTWRAIDLARAIESRDDTEEGGNRKQITGAWRSCHRFKKEFDEGQAKDHCFCGLHAGHIHQAKPSEQYPNGRPTCRYWQPGILEQFETEGIALLERTGDPLKPRTIFYRAQVYQLLPYLTPAQVGQLHEVTQLQHREYLKNHGIDLKTWAGLTENCLMPAVVSWRGAEITPSAKNLLGTKSDFCPQ